MRISDWSSDVCSSDLMVYQCHVTSQGALNMAIFQRSADAFLGLPWNQIGGSVLLLMLAEQAGLKPGELVWMGGDVHIYTNHFDQVQEQIKSEPPYFPTIRLNSKPSSIDGYRIEAVEVSGYDPHPAIQGDVAVY